MAFSTRRLRSLSVLSAVFIIGLYYIINRPSRYSPNSFPPHSPSNDGRIHWTPQEDRYPITSYIPLPTGKAAQIPKIQAVRKHEDDATKTGRRERQAHVKAAFEHSWNGYKTHAWLRDEVAPVTGGYRDPFGGWAATLVDALDTLWIMGMKDDFKLAVNAIQDIDFTTTEQNEINVFETTIRYLGGFLAAYDISGAQYPLLLAKAVEVGDILMGCFDTPNRMPLTRWDWKAYVGRSPQVAHQRVIVSELGSLSLEFTRLSQLTGDLKYYDAIQRISDVFEAHQNMTKLPGMWPIIVDAATPLFAGHNEFHIGGMSDSLYEYLPKQFMMLGGRLAQPRKMYEQAIAVAKKYLFFKALNSESADLLVSGAVRVNPEMDIKLSTQGQHLGCFIGGMVAIGSKIFDRPDDLEVARQITEGCVWAYDSQVSGIAPEIFTVVNCTNDCRWSLDKWQEGIKTFYRFEDGPEKTADELVAETISVKHLARGFINVDDKRYILRPEAIESVFIMYRITGHVEWQNKAWRMFEKIRRATRTEIAYSAIDDVTADFPRKMDSMESFWLGETLKYFYLIFSEMDLVSLDEYVLNTEAHPLKRPTR